MRACTTVLVPFLLLALAACGGSPAPANVPATSPQARLLPLHADAATLRDSRGREVLLRGINHIGLRSNATRPPLRVDGVVTPPAELFGLQDLEDADFALIASLGFNVVRAVISWEFVQPDPPPAPLDEAYLARVDALLDGAAAHGLYVILDFAQFGWSRAAGGNAGAPDWALGETCAGLPGAPGSAPPQASARVGCAFLEFWQNEPIAGVPVQDAYVELWRAVMRRWRDHPAVVMVDLFNEPFGGPLPPVVLELQYLYPFYRRLAAAVREIDGDVVIGFQPELFHSLGIPTPAPAAIGIDNAVFLPHQYTVAYFLQRADPSYPPGQDLLTRADFALTAVDAQTLRTPWLIGETGWTRTTTADGVGGPIEVSDPEAPRAFARDLTRLSNELRLGWAWFAYSSSDEAYGLWLDEALDEALLRALAAPYPRAIAGGAQSIGFDADSRRFELRANAASAEPLAVALSLRWQYPQGACVSADGAAIARIDAAGALQPAPGWELAYDAGDAWLELDRTPATLIIEPLAGGCAL